MSAIGDASIRFIGEQYQMTPQLREKIIKVIDIKKCQPQVDRYTAYYRANFTGREELLLRVYQVGGGTIVSLTCLGVILGGTLGGPKGALIGLGAGLGAGIIVSCIYGSVKIRQNFKDWEKACDSKVITDALREFLQTNPHFEEFLDPITQTLFEDPVITPCCQQTYEKASLLEWLNKAPSASCPQCRHAPVDKKELATDILMLGKMKRATANIVQNGLNDHEFSKEIHQAFEALNKDLEIQIREVVKETTLRLGLLLKEDKITLAEWGEKTRTLVVLSSAAAPQP